MSKGGSTSQLLNEEEAMYCSDDFRSEQESRANLPLIWTDVEMRYGDESIGILAPSIETESGVSVTKKKRREIPC